tara:strand:- start:217 stop:603 length:387 start_codon:yes stop_codon:yes gene_type:complete
MADTFNLTGSYSSTPASVGTSSGGATISAPVDETVQLASRTQIELVLSADPAVAVSIPAAANINVVIIRTVGGKVKARFTSSDGATQGVPVDPFAVVISESVNITALDVQRVAGVETTVKVFLGEKVT